MAAVNPHLAQHRRNRQAQQDAAAGIDLSPPPGSYDPNLDAELAATQRGFVDTTSDVERAGGRASNDYAIGQGDIGRQRDQGLADLLRRRTRGAEDFAAQGQDLQRGYGRSLADLLTSRARAGEDYGRSVAGLQRSYSQLGDTQRQRAQQSGTARGGALAQALAKRTANQAWDRAPIDQGYQRFGADSAQRQGRLNEDLQLGQGRIKTAQDRFNQDYGAGGWAEQRLNEGADQSLGRLGLQFQRGNEDRGVTLDRARRELGFFGQDVNANRFFQAVQSGNWNPKKKTTGAA